MIIDFTIENFRSFKDAHTFSLFVEQPGQHLAQHVAWPAGDKIGVLRTAGVYGANASGKSNLLEALMALRYIACESGDLKEDKAIPCYEPYRLATTHQTAPIKFEIEFFAADQVRYMYAVEFTADRINRESLDYYPSRQKANLFTRNESDTWETITFGGRYTGGIKRIPFFANNSYLAKAGENAGAAPVIRTAYKYFRQALLALGPEEPLFHTNLFDNKSMLKKIAQFLGKVDTGITEIQTRFIENVPNLDMLEKFPKEIRELFEKDAKERYMFGHQTEDGGTDFFEQDKESSGTQKLFSLTPLLMTSLASGSVLIMDEIERSFHPHIAELIIQLFSDPQVNTKHAQLIFTTHNINLMASNKMRRDQIWFTEKKQGATDLYSLDQFDKSKVKTTSPFPDWYNAGRFDAIPAIDYRAIADLLRGGKNRTQLPEELYSIALSV